MTGTYKIDFHMFPPVGKTDWRYAFATGKVRALAARMMDTSAMAEAAGAGDLRSCMELLSAGRYSFDQRTEDFAATETALLEHRSAARKLFAELVEPLDAPVAGLFRSRNDFTNMRLGLRRVLTGKPVGTDYDNEGNVPASTLARLLEEEKFQSLPDHMHRAAERAFAAYYRHKDIRDIDYAVDAVEAEYRLQQAAELRNAFLSGLFRIETDLVNIRAVFRMRFLKNPMRRALLHGGYVDRRRLEEALEADEGTAAALFAATPYRGIVESGVSYLASNGSFLRLEQQCERHMNSFLGTGWRVTSGLQPVVAYLLRAEGEIRAVRLILNAKKHGLETRLILDRLGI